MDKLKSRRSFLKSTGKMTAGIALAGALLAPGVKTIAESAAEEKPQPDYHWKANALPCELIKETTQNKEGNSYRSFEYVPDNRAHITLITFDINTEDMTVHNIAFKDGCDGSTSGVAVLSEGKTTDTIISRLKGLQCNLIKSGSSCPDQFANAVEQAVNIISGAKCTSCFFAGNFSAMKC